MRQNTIALVYDFDGTLIPKLKEYTILPKLKNKFKKILGCNTQRESYDRW